MGNRTLFTIASREILICFYSGLHCMFLNCIYFSVYIKCMLSVCSRGIDRDLDATSVYLPRHIMN